MGPGRSIATPTVTGDLGPLVDANLNENLKGAMVLKIHWPYFRFLKFHDLGYSASRSDSWIRPLAVVLVTVIGGLGGLDAA